MKQDAICGPPRIPCTAHSPKTKLGKLTNPQFGFSLLNIYKYATWPNFIAHNSACLLSSVF